MTARKRLKRAVRARADKTGESYTAALRHLRAVKEANMPTKSHTCWFCGDNAEDHPNRKYFVGPGTTICSECVTRLYELIDKDPDPGVPTSHQQALAQLSDEQLLDTLPNYAATSQAAEEALRQAILVRRQRGIGWDRIGDAIQLSAADAERRFGA